MSTRALGPFDVNVTPQAPNDLPPDAALARHLLTKRYHGDLDAESTGEMLSVVTTVKGSATYVAIERVNGILHGRGGSFALYHHGVMRRGVPSLTVTVVPDSGTGDLAGIAGTMAIEIDGKDHRYVLDYTLDAGH